MKIWKRGEVYQLYAPPPSPGESPIRKSLGTRDRQEAQEIALRYLIEKKAIKAIKPHFTINKAIEAYLLHSEATKKPLTAERDKYILANFQIFCQKYRIRHIHAITPKDIDDYFAERNRCVKKSTQNREMDTLKRFFPQLIAWSLLIKDPTKHLVKHKLPKDYPKTRKPGEIENLLAAADPYLREFLIGFLTTGMRKQELFKLRWDQVDLKEHIITIKGSETKGKRARKIPINILFLEILKKRHSQPNRNEWVFPSPRLQSKPVAEIRKRLATACKKAGISHTNLHTLRHTFASDLARRVSLPVLQELLGHSDIRSTQIYIGIFDEDKRKAINGINLPIDQDHGGSNNGD